MNANHDHAKNIFLRAAEIAVAAERQAYIADQCGADESLHKEVDQLLLHLEQLGPFLKTGGTALTVAAPDLISERPGTVIGPYKLLEQIGEGGFGIVFMAEQQKPVRRKVALKVIKPGMDTRQIIARFEAERQALALMDHPNIAKVLDASATESGKPYFVMELVKGLPITEYCNQKRLTARERLELFIPVCQAVQHAHQKGIIHRDLKPSNVLVTEHDGTPVVKVIDFGIAKATGQQLTDKTLFTNFAQMIGTPLYMSPEQAALSNLDIDTRSDIYALGVLLYELLTGTTPFDKARFREAGYDEILRIIREEEPPKPSTRISTLGQADDTVSAARKSDPKRLSQLCRGELDWIVMKALEKDRTRRYETAGAFAADVQRHLSDEPVEACPPSAFYKFTKFARRNKRGLVTGALVGTVLLGAIVAVAGTIGWQARDRATQQQLIDQAAREDLREAETLQKQDQWAKAFSVLERAKGRLEGSGLTALQARVEEHRREVKFINQIEKARMQMLQVAGRDDRDFAGADRLYMAAFAENGMDVTALVPVEASRLIEDSAIHAHLVRALDHWAYCKDHLPKGDGKPLRDVAQAADKDPWRQKLREPTLRKDRAALEKLAAEEGVPQQPPEILLILFGLLEDAKAEAAGICLLKKAQPLHPDDFWINYQLANSLGDSVATAAQATAFGRAALAIRPDSPLVYLTLANALGNQKKGMENWPEEEALLRKAMAIQPDNPHVYNHFGNYQAWQRKDGSAEVAFHKAIELKPDFAGGYYSLGCTLVDQQKLSEAEAAFRKTIKLKPDAARGYRGLGVALARQEKPREAEAAFRKAIELKPGLIGAHFDLIQCLRQQHKVAEEIAGTQRLVERLRKALDLKPDDVKLLDDLGLALGEQNKLLEAEAAFRKAIRLKSDFSGAYAHLSSSLRRQNKLGQAEEAARKAIELPSDSLYEGFAELATALFYQRKLPEAVAAYRKTCALNPNDGLAFSNLGLALRELGQFSQALASFKESQKLGHRGSSELLKLTEQFVTLDAKLPKILNGEIAPVDTVERLALVELCALQCRQLYAASARFYGEALADDLKLAKDHRYTAACAAAMAGCGQGKETAALDAMASVRLRQQSLTWLRAELADHTDLLEKDPNKAPPAVRKSMEHWQQDPDFNGVRGADALAKLPEAERREWSKL